MVMKIKKNYYKWIFVGLGLIIVFCLTFVKTPGEITSILVNITTQSKIVFLVAHVLFIAVIVIGLVYKKKRNLIFFSFIAFLSLCATIISTIFVILPNIIMFAIVFVLIVYAYKNKELNFELKNLNFLSKIFGLIGLIVGFWYLHWVEEPIWVNAIFYSPLGGVNCPTILTICAFLFLTIKPKSSILEVTVGSLTLYFGFFGIFLLGAYIDFVLIICGSFLLLRAYLIHKEIDKI